MRIVAVVGSREYSDLDAVDAFVDSLPLDAKVISGGARGVDKRATDRAKARGMAWEEFLPDYEAHGGRTAPLVRNTVIAAQCSELAAFWDRVSAGTKDVMRKAKMRGKPVTLFEPCAMCHKTLPAHEGWCGQHSGSSEHPF